MYFQENLDSAQPLDCNEVKHFSKNHKKLFFMINPSFYRIEVQFMKKLKTFITELCLKYSCI